MPPVTNQFKEITDLLCKEGAGGITSVRQLAKRLAELDPSQNRDGWTDQLRRYRRATGAPEPSEARMALIAKAFGVPRSRLPELQGRLSPREVRDRLESLEEAAEQAERERVALTTQLRALAGLLLPLAQQAGLDVAALDPLVLKNGDGH